MQRSPLTPWGHSIAGRSPAPARARTKPRLHRRLEGLVERIRAIVRSELFFPFANRDFSTLSRHRFDGEFGNKALGSGQAQSKRVRGSRAARTRPLQI